MYWLISFLQVTRGMDKTTSTFVLLIIGLSSVIGSLMEGSSATTSRHGGEEEEPS